MRCPTLVGDAVVEPWPLNSTWRPPDFEQRFEALLGAKRESAADVDAAVAADHRRRARARRRGARRLFAAVRSRRRRRGRDRDRRGGDRRGGRRLRRRGAEGARTRPRAGAAYHERQKPADVCVHRRARRRTRLALAADRRGRPLCARRRGELSVLGHDERRAGEGRGLPRASRWSCRRRTAGSIRWCWRRRASPASTRSTASAARRRSPRSPTAPQTIAPVAKIVGPGNAYVAAAKRRVFGVVGIDMIAGPSEVVILADRTADPRFVAADLLAQAEHDEAAQSILITDDAALARRASRPRSSASSPTCRAKKIAGASWRDYGAIILVPSARGRAAADRSARARASRDHARDPRRSPSGSTTPARSSSARIRPRRSATMSAAPTTCCRRRARRASPPGSACSTS